MYFYVVMFFVTLPLGVIALCFSLPREAQLLG